MLVQLWQHSEYGEKLFSVFSSTTDISEGRRAESPPAGEWQKQPTFTQHLVGG